MKSSLKNWFLWVVDLLGVWWLPVTLLITLHLGREWSYLLSTLIIIAGFVSVFALRHREQFNKLLQHAKIKLSEWWRSRP